jgi:hypothetical protein
MDRHGRVKPELHKLLPQKIGYVKKIPEFSAKGDPIDTLGWKVVNVNSHTKKNEKSFVSDELGGRLEEAPNGLHVLLHRQAMRIWLEHWRL